MEEEKTKVQNEETQAPEEEMNEEEKAIKEYLKIEEPETLNFFQRFKLKASLRAIEKSFEKRQKQVIMQQRSKQDIIEAIMKLSEVLDIIDDKTEEPVSQQTLELKSTEELLNLLEECLKEARKLI